MTFRDNEWFLVFSYTAIETTSQTKVKSQHARTDARNTCRYYLTINGHAIGHLSLSFRGYFIGQQKLSQAII